MQTTDIVWEYVCAKCKSESALCARLLGYSVKILCSVWCSHSHTRRNRNKNNNKSKKKTIHTHNWKWFATEYVNFIKLTLFFQLDVCVCVCVDFLGTINSGNCWFVVVMIFFYSIHLFFFVVDAALYVLFLFAISFKKTFKVCVHIFVNMCEKLDL